MPFTPYHMGPAIAIKAFFPRTFSLLIFGWSQILIDLEPLAFHLLRIGAHHGYSHNYLGATVIAGITAISGKLALNKLGVWLENLSLQNLSWTQAILSAVLGGYSHVFMDSLVHEDVTPFAPFEWRNDFTGLFNNTAMNIFCVLCAILGGVVYYLGSKNEEEQD